MSDSNKSPRVSVLMAAYNAMPFLPAAIDSILRQSFQDYELVIVDDGSTDKSREYVESLGDSRLRFVSQANGGLAAALNRGLEECRGEYIARMDADDESTEDRLQKQVAFLDSRPDIGCVGTQTVPFGESNVGGNLNLPTQHTQIVAALAHGRHAIVHASVMMRTEVVRQIGGYWSYRLVAEDYDLFLRMAEVANLACLEDVLYFTRFHMQSLNGSGMLRMRRAVDFACDRARRRQTDLPELDFDEFVALRESAPMHHRMMEALDAHARAQYRAAIAECCSGKKLRGYARLGWAAACAPTLTLQRLGRILRRPGENDRAANHGTQNTTATGST